MAASSPSPSTTKRTSSHQMECPGVHICHAQVESAFAFWHPWTPPSPSSSTQTLFILLFLCFLFWRLRVLCRLWFGFFRPREHWFSPPQLSLSFQPWSFLRLWRFFLLLKGYPNIIIKSHPPLPILQWIIIRWDQHHQHAPWAIP